MKTKDKPKKQTVNKAEAKLAILLKKMEASKRGGKNKPENKAKQLIENKRAVRNKPETNRKLA